MTVPTDTEIQNQALATASTNPGTTLLQWYSTFYTSTSATQGVLKAFKGLAKGVSYNFKCVAKSNAVGSTWLASVGPATAQTIAAAEKTVCQQFNFTAAPTIDTVNGLLRYCQYLYSGNGFSWATNGCIQCSLYDGNNVKNITIGLPDYDMSKQVYNYTCPQATKTSRLRFLTSAPRVLADATSTTANTTTICAVSHPVCNSVVKGGIPATMTAMATTLTGTGTPMATYTGVTTPNVLSGTNPTQIITDVSPVPVVTGLTATVSGAALTGDYSITLTNTVTAKIYYKVITSATTVESCDVIRQCTDKSRCGTAVVTSTATTVKPATLTPFTASTSYIVEYCVSNNIPGAQVFSTSASISTSAFTSPKDTTNQPNITSTFIKTPVYKSFWLALLFLFF